jgi:hypothetical protein
MALLLVHAEPAWNAAVGTESDVGLVVTVNQSSTGDPVTGLLESNFKVFESAGTVGPDRSREILPLFSFAEHPSGDAPGAYGFGVGGGGKWTPGQAGPIFIIDVEAGGDRGRAMTRVRF